MSEPGAHPAHPGGRAVSESGTHRTVAARSSREPTPWSSEPLELGEGARWFGNQLWLVDLLAGRLLSASGDAPGLVHGALRVPHPLGAVAPVRGRPGSWIAAVGHGIALLSPGGILSWLARPEEQNPVPTRMNDGAAHPGGGFWVGSMAVDGSGAAGSLFRTGPDGVVTTVLRGIGICNGPAFTHDGRRMYLADTARRSIFCWDLDPASGELQDHQDAGRRPEPFAVLKSPGGPDGMTVDTGGGLWVAVWGSGAVHRYRPDGRLDQVIELPAAQPTSVCLGGPTGRRLFVTTATIGLRRPSPADGLIYAVDVDLPGIPAAEFTFIPRHG
jgi:sugar lactone lactonase YvrE